MHFGINKLILIFLIVTTTFYTVEASEIRQILTTNSFQPYSIKDPNGQHSGLILNIVKEIQSRVGSIAPIKFNSWGRTQALAKASNATAIFPLVRTRARELDYKWIGHIYTDEITLAYLSSKPSLNDTSQNKKATVGTLQGSFTNKLLKSYGFKNPYPVKTQYQNLKKIMSGRISYWTTPRLIGSYHLKKYGLNLTQISFDKTLTKMKLYLAVSKDVSDETVTLWQDALYEMQQDGSTRAIAQKFMNNMTHE
jgi:polar amino acid transport system substrate-binding protein